jgi:hypothetical protein
MNTISKISALVIGFTIANFLYQSFQITPNYMAAFDRSFFQSIAVIVALTVFNK